VANRFTTWLFSHRRNDALLDRWSFVHLVTGAAMAWVMPPHIALMILVLWEPLEILVLSPLAKRLWGLDFGFESLRNAMSDIVFDVAGVGLGLWFLRNVAEPPFTLF